MADDVVGGFVCGVIGHQIGLGEGKGNIAATIGGAMIGAMIGSSNNSIRNSYYSNDGYPIFIVQNIGKSYAKLIPINNPVKMWIDGNLSMLKIELSI